ncbi:MAG: PEP-CTERM sorting domain-containing protein [Planctomycetota bacterium]
MTRFFTTASLLAVSVFAVDTSAVTVVSNAIEDINYTGDTSNPTNRFETILNNSGTNPGRFGAVRFDTNILSAGPDFTDASQYTLVSATLRLQERSGRNGNNGTLSGTIGGFFMNTAENSDWTITDADSINSGGEGIGANGPGWYGNSGARPGNFGGGTTGQNNVDGRSNGSAGLTSFTDGLILTNHTWDAGNSNEVIDIDLTSAGASLSDIQDILAEWVAGDNAGLGLYAEFGNQSFVTSVGIASGNSVDSSIDGDTSLSGVSQDNGLGQNGPGDGPSNALILEFEVVPEPSSLALLSLGGLLIARRRRG